MKAAESYCKSSYFKIYFSFVIEKIENLKRKKTSKKFNCTREDLSLDPGLYWNERGSQRLLQTALKIWFYGHGLMYCELMVDIMLTNEQAAVK